MGIKFGTLHEDGSVTNEMEIDLDEVESDNPVAFSYGMLHGKQNYPLPDKGTEEYEELASEYLRGYQLGQESK